MMLTCQCVMHEGSILGRVLLTACSLAIGHHCVSFNETIHRVTRTRQGNQSMSRVTNQEADKIPSLSIQRGDGVEKESTENGTPSIQKVFRGMA